MRIWALEDREEGMGWVKKREWGVVKRFNEGEE